MTAIVLNGTNAVAARLTIPRVGVWFADVDVDLGASGVVPSGRVLLAIGSESLVGTVDPRATGRLGTKARVQVVGGGGGWDRPVTALHYRNDFGVTSTSVYASTAAAVGEQLVDASPVVLGTDFVRTAGSASRVLAGVAWYVDAAGITRIGTRLAAPLGAGVDVLDWDATTRRAVLASDAIVWPGTVLTDARFGTARVRDVEQTFGEGSARVIAWCDTDSTTGVEVAGTKLARAIGAAARASAGADYLAAYSYRVLIQAETGRVDLQSLRRGGTVPDILKSVAIWHGIAGISHTLAVGSVVTVEFIAGDPKLPIVVAFAPDNPAPTLTRFSATKVNVGEGLGLPVLKLSAALTTWIGAVSTATGAGLPTGFTSTKLFTE